MRTRSENFSWSLSHEQLLGSFSRHFVFVNLAPQTSIPSREEIARRMRTDMTDATRLALARYARIHETRHFHDAFGTAAGLTAFMLHFKSLIEFVSMRRKIGSIGLHTPPPPLKTHYHEQSCPEDVKHFVRRQTLLDRAIALICGDLSPVFVSTTEDWPRPLVELQSSLPTDLNLALGIAPTSALCFPQAVGFRDESDGEVRATRYIPVDFGTLTEANSQMLQRELAFAEFGQEMRESIVSSTRTLSTSKIGLDVIDSLPVPYDTIDLLLGRIARADGAKASIAPDTIFRVTEYAMNGTRFDDVNDRSVIVFNTPGQTLSSLIETELTPARLNGPAIDLDPVPAPSTLKELLVHIDELPDWRAIEQDGSLESPLLIVYSYVMREVAKPLLVKKLDPKFVKQYATLSGYMELLPELPRPFIVGRADHIDVGIEDEHKNRVLSAWTKYCFVVDLLRQSFDGTDVVLCPRKHGFLSSWKHMNFSFAAQDCQELIDLTLCGEWASGQGRTLPNCLFSNSLRGLGFRVKSAQDDDLGPYVVKV